MTTKRRTATRPPTTKPSRIQVGDYNSYRLEPARSRTHYGEHREHTGGVPYGYRTRRADDAWLVVSRLNDQVYGLVEEWADGDWTFSKTESQVEAPRWLRPAMDGAIGNTIYNLEARLHRGETPAEAIAHGLFIRMTAEPETPAATGKSSEQLSREIEQATGVRISAVDPAPEDEVTYQRGGRWRGNRYTVVTGDGNREAELVERERVPPPPSRGKELRWNDGRWERLLRTGWVAAGEGEEPTAAPRRRSGKTARQLSDEIEQATGIKVQG